MVVSAADARRVALHAGPLEKKRRTAGWKKKFFVLTTTALYYFDAPDAGEARASLPAVEILSVEAQPADPQRRGFVIHLYRKKKEYRAGTTDERDQWLQALESVAAFKRDGTRNDGSRTPSARDDTATGPGADRLGNAADASRTEISPLSTSHGARPGQSTGSGELKIAAIDLPRLCESMKKAFMKQPQTSKSFSSRDLIDFVQAHSVAMTPELALDIGQQLIDTKLIVPLKSHIFEDDGSRFKFADAVTQRQPKNHLQMRSQSIQDLMGSSHFDPTRYAEDFLRKHASDKIDLHCTQLIAQKEQTIEALKEEISANYTSFIQSSSEIKTMENSVSKLKTLVLECKRSIQTLKSIGLDTTPTKRTSTSSEVDTINSQERDEIKELDNFIQDLEVHLHEHGYDEFTQRALEYKSKLQQSPEYGTQEQRTQLQRLLQQFITQMVEEFNLSMQTSERMHKKEDHLSYLIRLGEPHLATEMCLQNYTVRIALQLRHVPSNGNQLNYVINLSRTFFTSLLMCYEDFEHSFRGQMSSHFISLTVWISAQLERFASDILCHIFPHDERMQDPMASDRSTTLQSSTGCVSAIDVAEYKNITKFVSNALRYVFYGSRQLELAGLPTAHSLAPHLMGGVLSYLSNYSAAVYSTMKDEIKRERWDMAKRTIRDAEKRQDREIILTQSARSFYSMIQQFLRDVQRVLNPSCATTYISDVQAGVVSETDALLLRYTSEVLRYLEDIKLSSVIRLKQVVGILTNVAYIQDDCVARSTVILQEFIPKTVLHSRALDSKNAQLWRRLIVIGMQRGAQSILKMSIGWNDLDLSDDVLPDMTSAKEVKTLFVTTLLHDLTDITNNQLEKLLWKYRQYVDEKPDDNYERDENQVLLATMVVEGMLVEMIQDERWWHALKKDKRIGFGGLNKFIAELRVLIQSDQTSKVIEEVSSVLITKLTDAYRHQHPDKGKEVMANDAWVAGYVKLCLFQLEHNTQLPGNKGV